jgi:hypothetical protein
LTGLGGGAGGWVWFSFVRSANIGDLDLLEKQSERISFSKENEGVLSKCERRLGTGAAMVVWIWDGMLSGFEARCLEVKRFWREVFFFSRRPRLESGCF